MSFRLTGNNGIDHEANHRARLLGQAQFMLTEAPMRLCVENPVGLIGSRIRPADQYIQPYWFGHDASKRTGLWLADLPTLRSDPSLYVEPRRVNGRPRWANQTDSGQNKLGPSADRADKRAETYSGIAAAMAAQWGAR